MIQRKTKQQKHLKNQATPNTQAPHQLTFLEHVYELRRRVFWVVLTLVVASAAAFQYKDFLVNLIMAPLHGEKLVYLTPGGGFSFIFTLCIYFGALVSIPVILYHIYRFLQPLLGKSPKRFISIFMALSVFLAAAGATFGYFVAIPAAINFLTTFAGDAVSPNLTADSYLNFVVSYMLGLAALFQLPLLLFMFDHIRPFPPGTLLSTQRFVIIGAVIAAAVITPTPDVINQMIVAGPIVAVYQLGAVAVFTRRHISRRQHSKAVQQTVVEEKIEAAPISVIEEVMSTAVSSDTVPVLKEESQEPPTVTEKHAVKPVTHRPRTIDGFVPKVQATNSPAVTSARSHTNGYVVSDVIPPSRPLRTIDGLSVI